MTTSVSKKPPNIRRMGKKTTLILRRIGDLFAAQTNVKTGLGKSHFKSLDRAIAATDETLGLVLKKARFWEKHRDVLLNERQRIMLNKVLDGFDGK